jgi:DNA-binding Xre family transcriptional regulator
MEESKNIKYTMASALETIRENLTQTIKQQNLSIYALEKQAGISQGVLNRFLSTTESTTSVRFETIHAACVALGCTLDQLLGIKTPGTKPDKIFVRWDYNFFLEITNYVCKNLQNQNISATQIIEMISEIYTFSVKQNADAFCLNTEFADWIINKYSTL